MLRLQYRGQTQVPVEIEGLTPDWAKDKKLSEIEAFTVFHGNRKIPLAEMFAVSGDPADQRFEFEGNLSGVHWIGAKMTAGEIRIVGAAGRHVGSEMKGGSIVVEGDAGDWVGGEMKRGRIHVRGRAGHLIGAAYRGSAKGMTGGTILIEGDAGNEVGHTMRRGLIAVGGNAGDMLAFNMIAGTVLVFGECGIRPGAGMRRGTIGLLGKTQPPMLPSFRRGATGRPTILRLMLLELARMGLPFDDGALEADVETWHGDLVSVGRGEVLLRKAI